MEDVVVTLLNDQKVKKSEVPIGQIYVNEKGQEVRKELKVVPISNPKFGEKSSFAKFSLKVSSALYKAKKTVVSTANTTSLQLVKVTKDSITRIGEKRRKVKDNAMALMDVMLAKLMAKINIEETIQSLEVYQERSGKDASDLISLLKNFKKLDNMAENCSISEGGKVENIFLKVQCAIQNFPLEEILETARFISKEANIPFLPGVIVVLERILKFKPLVNVVMEGATKTTRILNPTKDVENQELDEEDQSMALLEELIAIAAEDGELSPNEEEYLCEIAREVGVDERQVLYKVKMKCMA